ncbi:hypothetical protein GJ744_000840 [Endocarpon pusillum]|uniref:Uncharacterized protein n=1 Tax=Endocarpon pusillum TaxID=364733 RepID=A0A8H7AQP5_9EURO|nr:hypothetical protein GJ744_000840 [Endocarpon pusillum]
MEDKIPDFTKPRTRMMAMPSIGKMASLPPSTRPSHHYDRAQSSHMQHIKQEAGGGGGGGGGGPLDGSSSKKCTVHVLQTEAQAYYVQTKSRKSRSAAMLPPQDPVAASVLISPRKQPIP